MYRIVATLLCLAVLLPAAFAQQGATVSEQYLLQLTNQHRAEHGLPPVTWDPALARAAKAHAQRIAHEPGPAEHQYAGEPDLLTRASQAGAHFGTVAENVAGSATTAAEIDEAWMNSPHHRANILNPRVNVIGIAVVNNNGLLSAVQDFAQSAPVLTPAQVEQRVTQILQDHHMRLNTAPEAHEDARKSCESETPVSRVSASVLQWDGPDLNQVPATILQQVPADKINSLAFAACQSNRPASAYTTYHVAILIF